MKIIETLIFTKKVASLMEDNDYRNFQNELISNPERGKVIKGSGVCAKSDGQSKEEAKAEESE